MIWTIVFLLAGAGCLGLAVWRLRQWFHRRKGIRIEAGIVDRRYQIPDDGTGIVDNKECGASVDLSFFWQGRSYRKVQDYKGILSVPAPEDKSGRKPGSGSFGPENVRTGCCCSRGQFS